MSHSGDVAESYDRQVVLGERATAARRSSRRRRSTPSGVGQPSRAHRYAVYADDHGVEAVIVLQHVFARHPALRRERQIAEPLEDQRAGAPRIGVALVAARDARAAQRGDRRGRRDLEQVARGARSRRRAAGGGADRRARRSRRACAPSADSGNRPRSYVITTSVARCAYGASRACAVKRAVATPPPTVSTATLRTSARPVVRSQTTAGSTHASMPGHTGRSQRPHAVWVSGASIAITRIARSTRSADARAACRRSTAAGPSASRPRRPRRAARRRIRSSATAVVLPRPPPRSTPMNLENARFTLGFSSVVARSLAREISLQHWHLAGCLA